MHFTSTAHAILMVSVFVADKYTILNIALSFSCLFPNGMCTACFLLAIAIMIHSHMSQQWHVSVAYNILSIGNL